MSGARRLREAEERATARDSYRGSTMLESMVENLKAEVYDMRPG